MSSNVPKVLAPEEESRIRDSLKRCSPETVEAALEFRRTGNPDTVGVIILGILSRFLEPDRRPLLRGECDRLRLTEDLGVDSLTMVEVVMLTEEILGIRIANEDLRELRTIGEVRGYVDAKSRGLPVPEKPLRADVTEILATLPQQPPFLFLQEAELRNGEAAGVYRISGREFFLEGHFKDRPVFPASIQLEALGQLGVLFLLKGKHSGLEKPVDPASVHFASADGVRCTRVCKPDEVLALTVKVKRISRPVAVFEGRITVNGEKAAFAEEIALTFDYLPETPSDASGASSGQL